MFRSSSRRVSRSSAPPTPSVDGGTDSQPLAARLGQGYPFPPSRPDNSSSVPTSPMNSGSSHAHTVSATQSEHSGASAKSSTNPSVSGFSSRPRRLSFKSMNPFSSNRPSGKNISNSPPVSFPDGVPAHDTIKPLPPSRRRLSSVTKRPPNNHTATTQAADAVHDVLCGGVSALGDSSGGRGNGAPIDILRHELSHENDKGNRVISDLRGLSPSPYGAPHRTVNPANGEVSSPPPLVSKALPPLPVHGVSLQYTDEEVVRNLYPNHSEASESSTSPLTVLSSSLTEQSLSPPTPPLPDLSAILASFQNIKLVNLVSSAPHPALPSLAVTSATVATLESPSAHPLKPEGNTLAPAPTPQIEPPKSPGFNFAGSETLLFGALPSPRAIVEGVNDVSAQLVALGLGDTNVLYNLPGGSGTGGFQGGGAAGAKIDINHSGVFPPLDRISCLTYWWGYELILPKSSMEYLKKVKSVSGTLVLILSALALLNGGVREILPFVRYAARFVEVEWELVQSKDEGEGVVCAATWVLPASLVARAWDFAPAPPPKAKGEGADSLLTPDVGVEPGLERQDTSSLNPPPSSSSPQPHAPAPVPSILGQEHVGDDEHLRGTVLFLDLPALPDGFAWRVPS